MKDKICGKQRIDMGLFCNCVHDNIKMYEEVIKTMHKLEREVEELKWYKEGIINGSLTRKTREGVFAYRKIEEKDSNDKKDDDSTLLP